MESHIATKKDHRCDLCGRRIPISARYFASDGGYYREHTNCLEYEREPLLKEGYNQNRKLGEVIYTEDNKIDNFGKLIE